MIRWFLVFQVLQWSLPWGQIVVWVRALSADSSTRYREWRIQLEQVEAALRCGDVASLEHALGASAQRASWPGLRVLRELRTRGAPLLSSAKRLSETLVRIEVLVGQARALSAPLRAQMQAGAVLIAGLWWAAPSLFEDATLRDATWVGLGALSGLVFFLAFVWMSHLESGPFRALEPGLEVLLGLEALLAFQSAGLPGDWAWAHAQQCAPELLKPRHQRIREEVQAVIDRALWEGSPIRERLEIEIQTFEVRLRTQLDAQVRTLSLKGLGPLFVGIFPGFLALMGWGIYRCMKSSNSVFMF